MRFTASVMICVSLSVPLFAADLQGVPPLAAAPPSPEVFDAHQAAARRDRRLGAHRRNSSDGRVNYSVDSLFTGARISMELDADGETFVPMAGAGDPQDVFGSRDEAAAYEERPRRESLKVVLARAFPGLARFFRTLRGPRG